MLSVQLLTYCTVGNPQVSSLQSVPGLQCLLLYDSTKLIGLLVIPSSNQLFSRISEDLQQLLSGSCSWEIITLPLLFSGLHRATRCIRRNLSLLHGTLAPSALLEPLLRLSSDLLFSEQEIMRGSYLLQLPQPLQPSQLYNPLLVSTSCVHS